MSFAINHPILADGLVADDKKVLAAVAFAYRELKMVVEPGGAIALACLLFNRKRFEGTTVVLTLSGGNMDAEMLQQALSKPVLSVLAEFDHSGNNRG
jgi:threonine dehydratase